MNEDKNCAESRSGATKEKGFPELACSRIRRDLTSCWFPYPMERGSRATCCSLCRPLVLPFFVGRHFLSSQHFRPIRPTLCSFCLSVNQSTKRRVGSTRACCEALASMRDFLQGNLPVTGPQSMGDGLDDAVDFLVVGSRRRSGRLLVTLKCSLSRVAIFHVPFRDIIARINRPHDPIPDGRVLGVVVLRRYGQAHGRGRERPQEQGTRTLRPQFW